VGDALGTTLEFSRRGPHARHTAMTGGGPFGLAPGQWTDDTAMALALAESLLARGRFDAADVMEAFLGWWRFGHHSCTGVCFDIGATTEAALARFERTRDPFAGFTEPRSAGNGSLMRVAPIALFTLGDAARASHLARLQSRLTHGAPEAVEACDLFVAVLRNAIHTGDKHAVLASRPWDGEPAIAALATGSWWGKVRSQIRSTGYVVDTLEAALWAVSQTRSFEDALVLAVNLGGDADTVGAVAGQLAGALYGLSGIPERWLVPLAWRDRIATLATALVSAGRRPRPVRRPRTLRPCQG
jgi:ADP-ribosyl-[dinitrogen reductase] hydrolase